MTNYTKRSLEGIWVGDCVGNLGQLYFAHDILKALETGLVKFGGQLDKFHKQFQFSDDTEEAIVLYNHLIANQKVIQDKLAMEFATRYMDRDPDGEIYGYGLNTRKVLRDIYEGTPWNEANKFIKKSEGMPSHVDSLVDSLSKGKGFKAAIHEVNLVLQKAKKDDMSKELVGSCGNGSAMRVGVLGAYLAENPFKTECPGHVMFTPAEKHLIVQAVLQSEVTHCHDEGVAGSIAITALAYLATNSAIKNVALQADVMYDYVLKMTPKGQVYDGIVKAKPLPMDLPVGKVIEVLGNGTHVTCQDTVPFCCYMAIKALSSSSQVEKYKTLNDNTYENIIIETSMAFGDVDTNCAIVGGIVGIVCPPPDKWKQFCQPMEGVVC